MAKLSGEVRITGVINDEEFSAAGEASGDTSTGDFRVKLEYTHIPKGWHPLMYMDVKVGLLFLREEGQGQNLLSLADGSYTSAATIDLGDGNIVRNNAVIKRTGETVFIANYAMFGTAHISELVSMEHFEETMLPLGSGRIGALGLTRWKTADGKVVDGLSMTKYKFDEKRQLGRPQVRKLEAKPTVRGMTVETHYTSFVRHLPRPIEDAGPYIGFLIS
jgi:hypothetical protein